MISDRVLALIAAQPGISAVKLHAALPSVKGSLMRNYLRRLRLRGVIESAGYGAYRIT